MHSILSVTYLELQRHCSREKYSLSLPMYLTDDTVHLLVEAHVQPGQNYDL